MFSIKHSDLPRLPRPEEQLRGRKAVVEGRRQVQQQPERQERIQRVEHRAEDSQVYKNSGK